MLNNEDKARIRDVLETGLSHKPLFTKTNEDQGLPLSALVVESAIQLGATASDWEQVVEIAGRLLMETNAIHSRYLGDERGHLAVRPLP